MKMKKRALSVVLALGMVLSLIAWPSVDVRADEEWDNQEFHVDLSQVQSLVDYLMTIPDYEVLGKHLGSWTVDDLRAYGESRFGSYELYGQGEGYRNYRRVVDLQQGYYGEQDYDSFTDREARISALAVEGLETIETETVGSNEAYDKEYGYYFYSSYYSVDPVYKK